MTTTASRASRYVIHFGLFRGLVLASALSTLLFEPQVTFVAAWSDVACRPAAAFAQSASDTKRTDHCETSSLVVARVLSKQGKRPRPATSAAQAIPSTRKIAEQTLAALVLIETMDPEGNPIALGSGFVLRGRRGIVTNLHVFKRASRATVRFVGKEQSYEVSRVILMDRGRDLCVVEAVGASGVGLEGAWDAEVAVGDEIYVAGNPRGLEGTFTKGIVSALRPEEGLIQLDAAISPGSSGGPVVDRRGRVLGVAVSSVTGGQNLNFAVPLRFLTDPLPFLRTDVAAAGALALSDLEVAHLRGPVKEVVTSFSRSTYDTEGNEIDSRGYWKGELGFRILWDYGPDGLITRKTTFEPNKDFSDKKFSRDEGFAEVVRRRHRFSRIDDTPMKLEGGREEPYWVKYDRFGNEIACIVGQIRTESRVGQDGRVFETTDYRNGNLYSVDRFSYEDDLWGNWITKFVETYYAKYPDDGFEPGRPERREITYY